METETASNPPPELRYATPAPSYGHKVWAGAALLLAGLGLFVVGGRFLIGVMMVIHRGFNAAMVNNPLSNGAMMFVAVLYLLAGAAFLGGILVFLCGFRALIQVMRS